MTLTIYPIYYDFDGSTAFRPLLDRWIRYYERSGCPLEWRILTDVDTGAKLVGYHHNLSAPTKEEVQAFADVIRPGNPFDYKSALICAALPNLPPCVIVDVDTLWLQDPAPQLSAYADKLLMIAEDSGRRPISLEGSKPMVEQSSNLMLFGEADLEEREWLVGAYQEAWNRLAASAQPQEQGGLGHTIREQRAWSVVFHEVMQCKPLPRELSWSLNWGKSPIPPTVKLVHLHGQSKWNYFTDGMAPPGGAALRRG